MHYFQTCQYHFRILCRYTPSPVRAPAPTPISPDKYAEFARFSRSSRRRSSSHDEQPLKSMRRWNTLSSVYDTEYQHIGQDIILSDKQHESIEGQRGVFLTEGVEVETMESPTTPRCCSPSPGCRTRIPKDIIEQFHGDIYGKTMNAKTDDKLTSKVLSNVSTGIIPPGWRPPRSRTPIQLAETPARYPPRPLRQPPAESVPKSLQVVAIRKPSGELTRCKSTPPRPSKHDNEILPQVLSDTSLLTSTSTVSMEVGGPSSVVTGSGAVPPPPSPEATTTLKNELQPTLETLCEEDERSSRNTSIADVMEKDVPLSRLSPLGGGSEMSDDSVELPLELNDNDEEEERATKEMTQEDSSHENTIPQTQASGQQANEEKPEQDATETNELHEGQTAEKHDSIDDQPSTEVNDIEFTTADMQELHKDKKATELDQLETFTDELLSMDIHSSELGIKNTTTSSDPQPPRGTTEPTEDEIPQRQNSTEELPDQPPGSPDITSTQDFTEGLDMGLDLAAELQAAMEGLDDFQLDNDDDMNDDEINES